VGYTPVPPDTVPALVIQRSPEAGRELPLDGTIELVFDRPMDPQTVEAALRFYPPVEGTLRWVDRRTLRFRPSTPLQRGAVYDLVLTQAARAADGAPLNRAYRFRFQTVGFLEVAQVVPADGTQDVDPTSATITVLFNRPVVPLKALEEQGDLPQPLTLCAGDPCTPVSGHGEWVNTSIYRFVPEGPLAGGTVYTARIAAGLTDTTGGLLAEDFVWRFATAAPQVVQVSPADESALVPVDRPIVVRFNQPVDPTSAQAAFHISPAVVGTFQVLTDTLIFTPTQPMAFDTPYQVTVEAGVTSAAGGRGMAAPYRWRFRTVPLPRIIGTDPRDGEKAADPYTPFLIHFNTPIDPATVMPNLTVTPPLSPTQVYTYFSLSDNTFVLHFGAEPSTDYEVRIGPHIADPYGNETGQTLTVRFRTAPLEPEIGLFAPGVGTYSAYQPARLYVQALNVSRLDARLYRLDPDQMAASLSRGWYDFTPPDSALLRRWSQPVEAPQNERVFQRLDLSEDGGPLPAGLYWLEVSAPELPPDRWRRVQFPLIVTPVNLTLKVSPREVLVWATDLATGEPVAGLPLTLYGSQGRTIAQATTDDQGLAIIARPAGTEGYGLWVVSREPFSAASTDWSAGISPWDFGLEPGYGMAPYRIYVYTDRPIYRPDQTVYFRGIVRAEEDVRYSLPTGLRQVHVTVRDAAYEVIYQETLPLSDFGTFHGEVALSPTAALGQYIIEVTFQNQGYSTGFLVAAYRPPKFEVKVTPADPEIVQGQGTSVTVEARYFFGAPLADAPVEWNLLAETYRFQPPWGGRYRFSDPDDPWVCFDCWWWREPPVPEPILSGQGRTDAQGRLVIPLPEALRWPDGRPITTSVRLTLEATVTGPDNQVIAGRGEIIRHQGRFYIGLAPRRYVGEAGREMSVDLVAVDWEGNRLPGQEVTVQVSRREWINTFVEEPGGGHWEWETRETPITTVTVTTDERGEAVATFTPPEGGSYHVVALGEDDEGHTVRSGLFLWVSGPGYVSWRRENHDRITLIADKSRYRPGETAEILIPSPFQGPHWALVTVERGTLRRYELVRMESNSQVYRLPLTAEDVPNVYVSVVLIQGEEATGRAADYKVGYVPLTVEPVPQTLRITLTPDRERAGPGEVVRYRVRVTDAEGKPVRAELSLDLVDKAVLSLQPREPEAIVHAFYGQRPLAVQTASGLAVALNRMVPREVEEQVQEVELAAQKEALPAAPAPTQGPVERPGEVEMVVEKEALAAAPPPEVDVRQEFADTAFWQPDLVTDEQGEAEVTVTLPDNLTTWVMRGVGLTAETQVGEATVEVVATKPLLIQPITPRFFVVGDRVALAATVHNNTDRTQEATVTLYGSGVTLDTERTPGPEQRVTLPAGGEAKVTWWVTVEDALYADLTFVVRGDGYEDASKPRLATGPDQTLPIYRYSVPEVVATGGQLEAAGSRTEVIALPPRYNDRRGELTIRLDPSLAAATREGLRYLEHFPYECTEQIVSRFLPNVLTYRTLRKLGIVDPDLEARLPALVEEGLEKLTRRQNEDGGWGWWPDDESNPTLSAYVLFGMLQAQEAGFPVRDDVLERGLAYLEAQVEPVRRLEASYQANRQAFLLFVLAEAGRPDTAAMDALFRRREMLGLYARAYLAMGLGRAEGAEDPRVATLLSDLNNAVILSATGAHWEEQEVDWWAMNTDTRSTAIILEALVRLDPENGLLPNVVRWLMVARREGYWETTQETAWALIALTDWMALTKELEGSYDYALWLNDEELAAGTVTPATVDEPVTLQVAVADLLREEGNRLTVARSEGPGRLYYTAHLRVFLPVEEVEPLDRGIIIRRRYTLADCEEGPACPEVREARVGDVIRVDLTIIAPNDLYYVVVEDPLPAGAEAIDTGLATTSLLEGGPVLRRRTERGAWWESFYAWWWHWYSRSELRDEKVVLFADYLPRGTYEYSYTMRAVQPGEYRVIPPTAREFYFPEVQGRGAGRLLTVTEPLNR